MWACSTRSISRGVGSRPRNHRLSHRWWPRESDRCMRSLRRGRWDHNPMTQPRQRPDRARKADPGYRTYVRGRWRHQWPKHTQACSSPWFSWSANGWARVASSLPIASSDVCTGLRWRECGRSCKKSHQGRDSKIWCHSEYFWKKRKKKQ